MKLRVGNISGRNQRTLLLYPEGGTEFEWVGMVTGKPGMTDEEVCKLADLLSAAPELLEALKELKLMEHYSDDHPRKERALDIARYAIAKAEGREA